MSNNRRSVTPIISNTKINKFEDSDVNEEVKKIFELHEVPFEINPMSSDTNMDSTDCVNDKQQAENEVWENMVLYYLARLKGLCDWGNRKTRFNKPLKKCESLEAQVVKKVTDEILTDSKCNDTEIKKTENEGIICDLGVYLAAGYEEGKQQAAKLVTRSLKYGVLTGILIKHGSAYRVCKKYLSCDKAKLKKVQTQKVKRKRKNGSTRKGKSKNLKVRGVKKNVRKTEKKGKCTFRKKVRDSLTLSQKRQAKKKAERKQEDQKDNSSGKRKYNKCDMSDSSDCSAKRRKYEKSQKLFKRQLQIDHQASSDCTSYYYKRKFIMYDDDTGRNSNSTGTPVTKKSKRISDKNINIISPSASISPSKSKSTLSIKERTKQPVKPKRPRPNIGKPVNFIPPMRKPRTKSQSKSPSRTDSDEEIKACPFGDTDTFNVPKKIKRKSSEILSISSTSIFSVCSVCKGKRLKYSKGRQLEQKYKNLAKKFTN